MFFEAYEVETRGSLSLYLFVTTKETLTIGEGLGRRFLLGFKVAEEVVRKGNFTYALR